MNDLHADEVACRAALPPLDHVPVSASVPAARGSAVVLALIAVIAARRHCRGRRDRPCQPLSRGFVQRTAQGDGGSAKPFGHSDGEGGSAFHECEPASDARFPHREWARLPHDGGGR